jgi:exodeoxyribonuclease VII small subunit
LSGRGFDELLADLENAIAKLADGTAPLEDLVRAHEVAVKLLGETESRLAELRARADLTAKLLSQ